MRRKPMKHGEWKRIKEQRRKLAETFRAGQPKFIHVETHNIAKVSKTLSLMKCPFSESEIYVQYGMAFGQSRAEALEAAKREFLNELAPYIKVEFEDRLYKEYVTFTAYIVDMGRNKILNEPA